MRLRDLIRDRVVGLYALLTLVFFHEPLTTKTFFFRDVYQFFYPKRLLLADALRAGTFPLWDPFTNGGQPFLATPNNGAFHPSNLLYAVMPTIVAFNFILVFHIFLCAVAAYWLARVVGLSRVAAFVVGIAYAFAGVTLSGGNLCAWLLAFPWIPLTIGLAHRALRDGRRMLPAAIAASMPLYAGMADLTALLFVLLFAWIATVRVRASLRRRLIVAAFVLIGAIGLTLLVTLPATSVISQSPRGVVKRTFESFTVWSVHPRRLPELIVPQFFGPTDTINNYWGAPWESEGFPLVLSIYFGVPLLLLAIFGAMRCRDDVEVPRVALILCAFVPILLALGQYLPGFRFIYEYVPLVTLFRYPVKVLTIALLPIALLAGCGVERVTAKSGAIGALIALALLAAIALTTPSHPTLPMSFAHAFIATAVFIAVMFVPRRDLALAALVTLDLFVAGYRVNAYAPRSLYDEPPLAAAVREVAGPMRFYSAPKPTIVRAPSNDIRWLAHSQIATLNDYNAATFGIPVVFHTDYDSLASVRMTRIGDYVRRVPWDRRKPMLDRAGVRAILTLDEIRLPGIVEIARNDSPSGTLHLYENRDATPARFIGRCGRASVMLVRRELNAQRFAVDAPCDGRVIFAEPHYDGWSATIDGVATPHIRADYAFTSVDVKRGRHVIDRTYFPPRLIAGLLGTLITFVVLLLIDLWSGGARPADDGGPVPTAPREIA